MKSTLAIIFTAILGLSAIDALAEGGKLTTIAALYQDQAALAGKEVRVQGKVVKVNNGIMERNFLHVQDGTGKTGDNDLTVTSKQTANVGDQVVVTGRVLLNKDFGAGYVYPLLVEEASISPRK